MPEFIPGLELNRAFYAEAVRPILAAKFPALRHSAALIGYGSDVLGYDSARSTDHEWGPRLLLFLSDEDHAALAKPVSQALSESLPTTFRGFSTSFAEPNSEGTRLLEGAVPGKVRHHVYIRTPRGFLRDLLDLDLDRAPSTREWLAMPEQKLLEITGGALYHDGLGQLGRIREMLGYYPHEVWLYLLSAQWMRIAQEEHFMSRCAEAGDDLGSRLLAARLTRDLIRLCFLIERKYAPYIKWLGTAFARLACGSELSEIFARAMSSDSWQKRERQMCIAYERVARMHNALAITEPLEAKVEQFYERPYLVLNAGRFAKAIGDTIQDEEIKAIRAAVGPIGSINQFVDSTNVLVRPDLLSALKAIFG
jgi:hypothetical protein